MKKIIFCLFLAALFSLCGCKSTLDTNSSDDSYTNDYQDTLNNERDKTINQDEIVDEQEEAEPESKQVTLYYQDKDRFVIPVTRKVEKQEGIARVAINGLIDSAITREELQYYGLYPVLPKGTEVLGINLKEGIATVDFNNKFLEYNDAVSERNIVSSVVYTLTEFNTIDGVKIWINGYTKGKLKFNTNISGILNRSNILINSSKTNADYGYGKIDVYLFKKSDNNSYIIPVSTKTNQVANDDLPGEIVSLLSKKYENMLYSLIPSETKLRGSSISDGILRLNFNDGITSYGGTAREQDLLKQILYSMKQVEGVEKVRILINGESTNLPEGTDISKEIVLPLSINNLMD